MKAGIRAWLYSRRAAPQLQVPAVAGPAFEPASLADRRKTVLYLEKGWHPRTSWTASRRWWTRRPCMRHRGRAAGTAAERRRPTAPGLRQPRPEHPIRRGQTTSRGATDSGPPTDAGARGSQGAEPRAIALLTEARRPAKRRRRLQVEPIRRRAVRVRSPDRRRPLENARASCGSPGPVR
jgi:hypothetical protein